MLISIETYIICDFPGGPDPLSPPLDPHMYITLRLECFWRFAHGLSALSRQLDELHDVSVGVACVVELMLDNNMLPVVPIAVSSAKR